MVSDLRLRATETRCPSCGSRTVIGALVTPATCERCEPVVRARPPRVLVVDVPRLLTRIDLGRLFALHEKPGVSP